MSQQCICGQQMKLELRTVVYARTVEILHVPVRTCEDCSTYFLLPPIKNVLAEYMNELGKQPSKRKVSFTEFNELSHVIHEVFSQEESDCCIEMENAVKKAIHDRTNLLLDLYRYAESVKDHKWTENLRQRLTQLSGILSKIGRN
ncbi:hypothetical protein [Paenibacillus sp. IHBB 10380]|uniref:hypothetical protein n=1 Tax=Paenibacillus sp. IHBB 10380 TaxID=1566358 RepID=UPI0005CFAB0D|nr:hypothetical protein [Paenibacillus sp. IHBB 10380]AJS57828.1 hypothetical protein UB51_04235 [Paenibacillus sp. IHBB 10380]